MKITLMKHFPLMKNLRMSKKKKKKKKKKKSLKSKMAACETNYFKSEDIR